MGEDPKPESFNGKVLRWLTALWRAWLWLRERAFALQPCRVAILLVFAGLAFLLLAAQGEDVARALAERRSADPHSWQVFWFFAASLAWSLSAWYWARVMLSLKLPDVPPQNRRLDRLRTWTPRLLGFLATLGVAAAFYKASLGYEANEHQDVKKLLQFYAFWCAMGAVAFLVAVSVRRKVARAASRRLNVKALNLPRLEEQAYGALELKDLEPADARAPSRHHPRRRRALRHHAVRRAGRRAGPGLGRDRPVRGRRVDRTGEHARLHRHAPVLPGLLGAPGAGRGVQLLERQPRGAHPFRGADREAPQRARAPARVARWARRRDQGRQARPLLCGERRGRRHPRRLLDRDGARRDPEQPSRLRRPPVLAERRLGRQPRRQRVRRPGRRVARAQAAVRPEEKGAGRPRRGFPFPGRRRHAVPRPGAALPAGSRPGLRPRGDARAGLGGSLAEERRRDATA